MDTHKYTSDILKNGFLQLEIPLNDDYDGKAVATLVRRLTDRPSHSGVLYIHGFNDYFFQKELAYKFNEHGINFYALDLRKYGRSYLPHQKFNDIRNLEAYFEEIKKAIDIIRDESNSQIILMGHSTGGLIVTLFAKHHLNWKLFDGIILNSTFFEFNVNPVQRMLIPIASFIGKYFPKIKIAGGFSEKYGESIHVNYSGEWEYDLNWKPNLAPEINIGWLRAVHRAQLEMKKKFHIDKPVLILHSSESVIDLNDNNQISSMDSILNVKHIEQISKNITGDVEIQSIKGGLHDLVLSRYDVREIVYKSIFEWIKKKKLA